MGSSKSDEKWKIADIWLGLLFLATGLLIIAITHLAFGRGLAMFIGFGWLVGPVFVLLGLNAAIRSLYSAFRNDHPENTG